ncbi:MAG: alpha/beta fold hydrolase [Anaerolineae bacterium]|nr:MAG: alpha/beta fold hydrolase [Anaerolineae bacterium]
MNGALFKKPDPFFLEGGPTGILLIHGFTASPSEMSYLGNFLNERGLTVSAPLLPGHGTTPEDANRYRWQHWANHLTIAFAEMQDRCSSIFIGGFSAGALLALYLAARLGRIDGLITYAPALKASNKKLILAPVIKYFRRTVPKPPAHDMYPDVAEVRWAYDEYPARAADELRKLQGVVKASLPDVRAPILIIYSTADETVKSEGIELLLKKAGSNQIEVVALHNSGHIITLDQERDMVAEKSYQFISRYETG